MSVVRALEKPSLRRPILKNPADHTARQRHIPFVSIPRSPTSISIAPFPTSITVALCPTRISIAPFPTSITVALCPTRISIALCPTSITVALCPTRISTAPCPTRISTAPCPTRISTALCPTRISIALCPTRISIALCPTRISTAPCPTRISTALCPTRISTALCPTRISIALCPTSITVPPPARGSPRSGGLNDSTVRHAAFRCGDMHRPSMLDAHAYCRRNPLPSQNRRTSVNIFSTLSPALAAPRLRRGVGVARAGTGASGGGTFFRCVPRQFERARLIRVEEHR